MKNTNVFKNIGNNIQLARLTNNLTQEALAEKCNVSAKYISALERRYIRWQYFTFNKHL